MLWKSRKKSSTTDSSQEASLDSAEGVAVGENVTATLGPAASGPASDASAQASSVDLHPSSEAASAFTPASADTVSQTVAIWIDDFAPHIETEIKRRLSARMERLLSQYND